MYWSEGMFLKPLRGVEITEDVHYTIASHSVEKQCCLSKTSEGFMCTVTRRAATFYSRPEPIVWGQKPYHMNIRDRMRYVPAEVKNSKMTSRIVMVRNSPIEKFSENKPTLIWRFFFVLFMFLLSSQILFAHIHFILHKLAFVQHDVAPNVAINM